MAAALAFTVTVIAISLDFALQAPDPGTAWASDETLQLVLGDGAVRRVHYVPAAEPDLGAAVPWWVGVLALAGAAFAATMLLASRRQLAAAPQHGAPVVTLAEFRARSRAFERDEPQDQRHVAALDELYGEILDAQAAAESDAKTAAELAAVRERLEHRLPDILDEQYNREGLKRAA